MMSALYETSRKCTCTTENGISSKVWPKDKNPPGVNVYEKKADNVDTEAITTKIVSKMKNLATTVEQYRGQVQ